VTRALDILKSELDTTLALCGETDITKVGRHNLLMPPPSFIIPPPEKKATRKAR
jgi:L-lactate dehydrogenase (cytochrome)